MVSLFRRDDWSIGGQHEVNARVRHQIGLEPWIFASLDSACNLLAAQHMRYASPVYDSLQI